MMHAIVEVLLGILFRILLWCIFLPISMLLASPAVLIGAAFTGRSYWGSVKDGYYSVYKFWEKIIIWF